MSLTPEQIADAVLRGRRGRGQIFDLRDKIWKWLLSTNWFKRDYPKQIPDQVKLVDEVEKIIRSRWSKKAAQTREKAAKKTPDKAPVESPQLKLDI